MVFISIVLANLLVSCIALVGVLLLVNTKLKSDSVTTYFVSFAAGTMLATACLSLLQEALHETSDPQSVLWALLAGMVGSFVLERTVLWYHHHHEDSHDITPSAFLILVGDGLHNWIDGVAIAAAFLASPVLGWATTLSISAHELPQEFADISVLLHSGMKPYRALFWNFVSGLTAVGGGIMGFFFLKQNHAAVPFTLAITAGIFIYICCADLIPSLHEKTKGHKGIAQLVLFFLGVLTMAFILQSFPHTH